MPMVKQLMSKAIEKITIEATAKDIANIMAEKNIGSVLIEHNDNIVGIITETDIVRKVVRLDKTPQDVPASTIMNAPVLTIDVEASILDANDMMDRHHIRHLAVTEEGNIIAVLSVRDLMHPVNLGEETY